MVLWLSEIRYAASGFGLATRPDMVSAMFPDLMAFFVAIRASVHARAKLDAEILALHGELTSHSTRTHLSPGGSSHQNAVP
jgi:hypothetical protein